MSEAGGILGPGGPDLLIRMRGRAVGAIVCAGFGAYALYWWTQAAFNASTLGERRLWFGGIVVVAAVLVVWGIANLVALRHEPRVVLDKRLVRFYRIGYALIVATEGAAISVGGPILGHFHRPELVWAMDRRGSGDPLFASRQTVQNTSLLLDRCGDFAGRVWLAADFCKFT